MTLKQYSKAVKISHGRLQWKCMVGLLVGMQLCDIVLPDITMSKAKQRCGWFNSNSCYTVLHFTL